MLQAELPNGVAGVRERCHVEIDVMTGKIVACRIRSNSGRVVAWGDDVLREVYRLGILDWNLTLQRQTPSPVGRDLITPALTNPTIPSPLEKTPVEGIPTSGTSLIPRRLVLLEPWQMASWPRTYRMVYALVDGKKSVTKITEILSVSPGTVEQVLRDLQAMRVIAIE
jgi:hypothetical protein